jgi:hypothetical protein
VDYSNAVRGPSVVSDLTCDACVTRFRCHLDTVHRSTGSHAVAQHRTGKFGSTHEKVSPPESGRALRTRHGLSGGRQPAHFIHRDPARSRYIFRVLALTQPRQLFGIFLAARLRPGGI